MFQFSEVPNLRHMRMIQVIGQVGGVSSASRYLSTSQPAVTQAVANIENDIGAPVFERCATGTYPTAIGKIYLQRIDRFLDILDRTMAQVMPSERGAQQVDRLITGTQLRALMVTCEVGRVTEIAENLGLSAASLYRSARSLERVLGKPLFDKTAQGPIPNKTANFMAREFRRAVREIEMARGEILSAQGNECLELIIGTLPMAGSTELALATRRFMAAHPSVRVRVVLGEYHKLLSDLSNSRIDLIFGMLRKPDWAEDVFEEVLFHDRYCMVARPGHPLAKRSVVTPEDLAGFDWIVPAKSTPRRNRIEQIFEGCSKTPRFQLETSSLTMSRAFLVSSDTLTLMTRSEVGSDLENGTLIDLPCPFLDNILKKGVTTRSDWLPTRAHAEFLELLRDVTRAEPQREMALPVRLVG